MKAKRFSHLTKSEQIAKLRQWEAECKTSYGKAYYGGLIAIKEICMKEPVKPQPTT